jgi:hypothetical protein
MRSVSHSGTCNPLEATRFLMFWRFPDRSAYKRPYKEELCHH